MLLAAFGAVEFTYRLSGTGWAEARVADGASSATVTASYVGDALRGLLDAVGLLLEGADEARCCWEEEPGGHRWIFQRAGSDVHLCVLSFVDIHSQDPDIAGTMVFETTGPLGDVASAIADGAEVLLDEHGEKGHERLWVQHPFPQGPLDAVRARLGRS